MTAFDWIKPLSVGRGARIPHTPKALDVVSHLVGNLDFASHGLRTRAFQRDPVGHLDRDYAGVRPRRKTQKTSRPLKKFVAQCNIRAMRLK
ncbi:MULTISPECIES: hypothetical protein [Methylobacterium]|uniref:hypothetical protein n=1 Tax=Methylobacterium TaxID=407 RepID=UPI0011C81A13|nr:MULTISPECIES: hypothetical protein [Methylobacterium]TXN33656.1 hypothetical protein FV220_01705 [Methylobacterium sp. WL19]